MGQTLAHHRLPLSLMIARSAVRLCAHVGDVLALRLIQLIHGWGSVRGCIMGCENAVGMCFVTSVSKSLKKKAMLDTSIKSPSLPKRIVSLQENFTTDNH